MWDGKISLNYIVRNTTFRQILFFGTIGLGVSQELRHGTKSLSGTETWD